MNSISNFFAANMVLVFFINGLAFFVMGLAVTLKTHRPSRFKLAEGLWLLAVFAFLRCLANWGEMFLLIQNQAMSTRDNLSLQALKAIMLPLSIVFLFQFVVKSFIAANLRLFWMRWVPFALFSFWLLALIYTMSSSSMISAAWLLAADVWGRYFLYLPASALAGLALFIHSRILREMKLPHIARDCFGAAMALGLKTIVAGMVVSPAPYFPASFLNESSFLAAVGVPVQIFRMVTTLAIAYFFVRMLNVFEIEQKREIEAATQLRFQGQQEALEAQRQAREEIGRWSKKLENMINTITMAINDALSRVDKRASTAKKYGAPFLFLGKAGDFQEGVSIQPSELREMLNVALHEVLEFTMFEVGGVFIVDDRTKELVLAAHLGLPEKVIQGIERVKFNERLVEKSDRSWELIAIEDICEDSRLTKMAFEEGLCFSACVPLRFKDKVQGVMYVASISQRPLKPEDKTLLAAIGQQIGVAIESMRLYERVQNLAVLEERDRIGRELHDGLAQVLGYLYMKSKALEELLSSGGAIQAKAKLREIQEVARDAYRDVRESILDLRTTITPGTGLIPTLKEYLHKFSQQSGLRAELVIEGDGYMEFTPAAEIQLLRIIQEGLTNVRKHSQANRAWVRFEPSEEGAVITIEDDGQGFDPSRIGQDGQQHFGLQTIRERAESVGGDVQILVQPGQGTKVVVKLPLDHGPLRRK